VLKKKDWYVSSCHILDVVSQGKTQKKASDNLVEALTLFFLTCFERGTLGVVFKNNRFRPIHQLPFKENPIPKRFKSIDVPLPFQIKPQNNPNRRHA
jgi:hypothetical protein